MRKYSMSSKNRRNHQRWLNSYCKMINKGIEDDNLFLGRFYIVQKSSYMEWFEDKSGGIMHTVIEMRDRKTGKTKVGRYNCLSIDWKLWCDLNNFIVEDCKVWQEVPRITENRIDYRPKKAHH